DRQEEDQAGGGGARHDGGGLRIQGTGHDLNGHRRHFPGLRNSQSLLSSQRAPCLTRIWTKGSSSSPVFGRNRPWTTSRSGAIRRANSTVFSESTAPLSRK